MKKKIVFCLLSLFLLICASAFSTVGMVNKSPLQLIRDGYVSIDEEISHGVLPYYLHVEDEMQSVKSEILFQSDGDVELLWDHPGEGNFVFSSFINGDSIPDILSSSYAIDGLTGETIYQFEEGIVIYVGDIDLDNKDEIISYKDGKDNNYQTTIYCLDSSNGEVEWTKTFDSSWIFHASIGDILGDDNNEIILCLGDLFYRSNHYIYCLDGNNGDTYWKKWTDGYPLCCEVSDVNNDGENEVIASVSGRVNSVNNIGYLYCLNSGGIELWNFSEFLGDFRHFCLDNLNNDNYKEILTEDEGCILCVSGLNGSVLWNHISDPAYGSIQSIETGDLIGNSSGKEVIIGGVGGVYCLFGGNTPPQDGREIWHLYTGAFYNDYVMSTTIGDIDKDGLLDVACLTFQYSQQVNGRVIAINGQDGSCLWEYENCGADTYEKSIMCLDLNGDGYNEVVAKDRYYICALITPIEDNTPPNNPTIEGPTNGKVGIKYDYKLKAVDPDGDYVKFFIDWGDGNTSNWIGPYEPGKEITVSHIWTKIGTYTIKVKAKDIFGAESDWVSLPVTMPLSQPVIKSYSSLYQQIKTQILNLIIKIIEITSIYPNHTFFYLVS